MAESHVALSIYPPLVLLAGVLSMTGVVVWLNRRSAARVDRRVSGSPTGASGASYDSGYAASYGGYSSDSGSSDCSSSSGGSDSC